MIQVMLTGITMKLMPVLRATASCYILTMERGIYIGKSGKLYIIVDASFILCSFGNPHHDEMSILAPLKQCCR